MKKILFSIFALALALQVSTAQTAAVSTIVTDTLSVNGDCSMCKKSIEKACFGLKGVQKADWDDEQLTLVVTYDTKKTSADAILKRIALIGYDNEKYKASDKSYFKLDKCCQYDRSRTTTASTKK